MRRVVIVEMKERDERDASLLFIFLISILCVSVRVV